MAATDRISAAVIAAGNGFMMLGGGALATIFAAVILNGHWPDVLHPVRVTFGAMGNTLGWFALPAEIWLFIGPGALVRHVGERMAGRL